MLMTVAACGPQPEPSPFRPVADMEQLMDHVVTPAATAYWRSVSIIIDRDGITENFPTTDEEWDAVYGAAITLAEAGNLMMMAPRAVPDDEWMRLAAEMVEAGVVAMAAAEAQDPDQVFEAGEVVYLACEACHDQYLVDPASLTFLPSD